MNNNTAENHVTIQHSKNGGPYDSGKTLFGISVNICMWFEADKPD